jgi:hypothetical protein
MDFWICGFPWDNKKLVWVFKANTDRNTPEYKFGIEVPRSIQHALLLDQMNREVHIIPDREFGEFQGAPLILDRSLYRLRSSTASFHEHLLEEAW